MPAMNTTRSSTTASCMRWRPAAAASPKTGWQPFHLVLQDGDRLLGVAPMYLKSHSRGEYVFDGGWAEAWYRAGGEYYPKLQASIPFTPATGPRLLSASGERAARVEQQLLAASVQIAERIGVSSLHYTFMPRAQWQRAAKLGLLQRVDTQYHWANAGFDTFDEFLSRLASKKRKNVRRERREAVQDGIEVEWVTGSDLTEHHWDCFHDFYMDTANRKWGTPYLNRRFFSLVSEAMPERTLLIMARRRGRYIAGALNFIGSHALFGRNWGCLEDHRFLHFELCYYQAIDFAIAHGLQRVEAGAQGPHKVARGYLPRETLLRTLDSGCRASKGRRPLPGAGKALRQAGCGMDGGAGAVSQGHRPVPLRRAVEGEPGADRIERPKTG